MGHADFRVGKRIFATLGYPDGPFGMVKLTPTQQAAFVKSAPVFTRAFYFQRGLLHVHSGPQRWDAA